MTKSNDFLPLLLIDDNQILTLADQGTFKCTRLTFEEVEAIVELHQARDIVCCFKDPDIESIIFDHLHLKKRDYSYISVDKMEVGQDAIAFKRYAAKSETTPILHTEQGMEAKKILNVYVYCQLFTRIE